MEQYRTVISKYDGLKLDIVEMIPEGKVRGIVQIVHGMQEHKERYLHFMAFLAEHGFACIAHDHRGHGGSVKSKEDLGFFYDESGDGIVEDLNDVAADLRLRYPHVPFFVLGHSMGSLIVRKYLKKYDDRIDGLLISGAVAHNPMADPGLVLVKALSALKGPHAYSRLVENLSNGSFDKGIEGNLKNRWLSVNEDNVKAFNADEKSGFPFTLNGYQNLLQLVKDVYSDSGWQMHHKDLPILFLAGKDDPVIGGEEGFKKSVQSLQKHGYQKVSSRLYPGMRHEILNETNRYMVYEDILKFLEEYTK